jgi:RNA polymerase sigma factor for flagellar operon FliA
MTLTKRYAMAAEQAPGALVQEYAPLVKRIANHLRGRLPQGVDQDDLVQVGLMALLEAARQYSPTKGASFERYAGIRVRGAMLDEVRSSNWTPRSVYRRQRQLTAAIQAVENRTGKPADAREIAAEMSLSLQDYFRLVTTAAVHKLISLDQESDDGDIPVHQVRDPDPEPSTEIESDEVRDALIEAIRALPEREALVMSLYYDEELNLKDIGEVLGVTESRVCQIHGHALARVRARVTELISGTVSTAT